MANTMEYKSLAEVGAISDLQFCPKLGYKATITQSHTSFPKDLDEIKAANCLQINKDLDTIVRVNVSSGNNNEYL